MRLRNLPMARLRFGDRVGIATGRLHARGPVGVRPTDHLQIPHPRQRSDPAVNSKNRANSARLLPPHAPGMRIGLVRGYVRSASSGPSRRSLACAQATQARSRLVAGNTRKSVRIHAVSRPTRTNCRGSRSTTHHPRIDVTGLEAVIKTRYTYDNDTLVAGPLPRCAICLVMGADNLRSFHRWQKWRKIAEQVPIVVVDRLGPSLLRRRRQPCGQHPCPSAYPGTRRRLVARSKSTGIYVPSWPQIPTLIDGTACAAPQQTPHRGTRRTRPGKRNSAKTSGNKRGNKIAKRKYTARTRKRRGKRDKRGNYVL